MTQEEVIRTVVDAIERVGSIYMIAGSFASNLHGVPRMTHDADIVVDIDEAGVLRLVRFLEQDFYVSEDAAREAVRSRRWIGHGSSPNPAARFLSEMKCLYRVVVTPVGDVEGVGGLDHYLQRPVRCDRVRGSWRLRRT